MKEKILQIGKPPVVGYQHHANPLSVLSGDSDYLSWFFSNYIQLYLDPQSVTFFNFYFNGFVPNFFAVSNPLLDLQIMKKDVLLTNSINVISFVIHSINSGRFVETSINEYYIESRHAFQKHNFDHEILVYGYNIQDKYFYTLGYTNNNYYETTKVSFDVFEKAFSSTSSHPYSQMIRIYEQKYIKDHKKCKYTFDLKLVCTLLNDYLTSYNTSERLRMVTPPMVDCKFGMDACRALTVFLERLSERCVEYDIKPFHILWEHKACMVDRLIYMKENNYLQGIDAIISKYETIKRTSMALRGLLIKWDIIKDNRILDKMKKMLNKMLEEESAVLSELIDSIYRSEQYDTSFTISM